MIDLTTDELRLRIDPLRGGAIRSIVSAPGGVELLHNPHWPPAALADAHRDEGSWTAAWAGGWNALVPNAGAACTVAARRHPFHGSASIEAWTVADRQPTAATLHWADRGELEVIRTIRVDGPTVTVDTTVRGIGPHRSWHVFVEHLILGEAILGSGTVIDTAGAEVEPLADSGERLSAPRGSWPLVDRGHGMERWSTRATSGASRYGVLRSLSEREITLHAPDASIELSLAWSSTFPYLWFWEERQGTHASPWNGRTVCLGLEPSTVSTGEGLGAAVTRGEARTLAEGESIDYRVALRVTA